MSYRTMKVDENARAEGAEAMRLMLNNPFRAMSSIA